MGGLRGRRKEEEEEEEEEEEGKEKRQNLSTALHGTAAKEQIHMEKILCFGAF